MEQKHTSRSFDPTSPLRGLAVDDLWLKIECHNVKSRNFKVKWDMRSARLFILFTRAELTTTLTISNQMSRAMALHMRDTCRFIIATSAGKLFCKLKQ